LRSSGLIGARLRRLPVPRQQVVEPLCGMVGDAGEHVGEPRPADSTSFNLQVTMTLYMAAACCPLRSEPANSHDFRPKAIPRIARSAALFDRQIRPSSRKRETHRPLLPVHQDIAPAALSPFRRQNPKEEPGALAVLAGIWAGGEEKSWSLPQPWRPYGIFTHSGNCGCLTSVPPRLPLPARKVPRTQAVPRNPFHYRSSIA
jgi:hypothetical protein